MKTPATIDAFECADRAVCRFTVHGDLVFDLDAEVCVWKDGSRVGQDFLGAAGIDVSWLPAGRYELACPVPGDATAPVELELTLRDRAPDGPRNLDHRRIALDRPPADSDGWQLRAREGTAPVERLSWYPGNRNWLYRHFDHAARTIIHLFFRDHPKLRGDILDVGCGDGITDLGVALRKRPRRLVGVDPFRGYRRLPGILKDHHLPQTLLDCPGLEYRDDDGNHLDFDDNSFDVVLSWGSLEHIAGGYERTLSEIRRVLRPGGLFFVHPGLFYGSEGNHLGEFFDDPWIHLKLDREDLEQRVLNGTPQYMDRAGEEAPPSQYWQWYTELNPITVADFESEMRGLDFEPWRFALRTDPVVEYTAEMQRFDMATLGITELYAVFVSRKSSG